MKNESMVNIYTKVFDIARKNNLNVLTGIGCGATWLLYLDNPDGSF